MPGFAILPNKSSLMKFLEFHVIRMYIGILPSVNSDPVKISGQLLGDVGLPPCGQPDHTDEVRRVEADPSLGRSGLLLRERVLRHGTAIRLN